MKKSLFTSPFAPLVLGFVLMLGILAGPTLTTNAQAYYGNYSNYSSAEPYNGCVSLTVFQGLGSTDAVTYGQVSMLQIFLNQTGYLSGVTGIFDNGTYVALMNYQRAYGLPITGIADPATRALISQQSCGAGIAGGYQVSYPVTNYANGSNCYWTGGTYNSTYVCTSAPIVPVVPLYPYPSGVCNNYGNNYNYGNWGNGYNNCNPYGVVLNSLSVSYGYNGTATITLTGSGFSGSDNIVYFGNALISSNAYSNGRTLIFTVPAGYYAGTYGITVKNAQGFTSNSLSFTMGNGNNCNYNNNYGYGYSNSYCYNNNGWNNNYSNNPPSLSNISGPSIVQAGTNNSWNVTSYSSNNDYVSVHADWGDVYGSTGDDTQSSYSNGSQTFSFSHVYQSPGTYTLRITATDNSGRTTYVTYTVVVNGQNGYGYPQYGY